ncbi:MAG: diaminopimelate dehydrogenase [Clostridia bacterium]|nr:diaminopimelate dehydrogenase [Clostridia bacterium]
MTIRIGIMGYGNLGRGVEYAVSQAPDMELSAVFTRRDPKSIKLCSTQAPVLSADTLLGWKDHIDVMILCGGSATDLPEMTPKAARLFHVVDSFDTHARIPEHFHNVNVAATESRHTALISAGWDPGMFSMNRLLADAILPDGASYTFWGKGVSQGHSDAIRRIPGVVDARQYTVPVEENVNRVRNKECPTLTTREKHTRECFVVAEEGADLDAIRQAIVTMPNYFDEYDTTVHFVSLEELRKNHSELPHGGSVLRSGITGWNKEHRHSIEYRLELDSNPEFTGSVLTCCARAVYHMAQRGDFGCKTIFDVPPIDFSPLSRDEMISKML